MVQFVIETGRPITKTAHEVEINKGLLGKGVNQWKRLNLEPEKALSPVKRARVADMNGGIRKLQTANGE